MSNKKKTAVEFIIGILTSRGNVNILTSEDILHAKSLEQKNIVDAFDEGLSYNMYPVGGIRYYNENYGK